MKMMNFYEWITQKYLDWQKEVGERRSVSDFAKYIGVGQPTVSTWMQPTGSTPRSTSSINKLVAKFGDEVYPVLGLEPPSSLPIEAFPEDVRGDLQKALAEANQVYRKIARDGKRLPAEDARKILSEIFARYGFSDESSSNDT